MKNGRFLLWVLVVVCALCAVRIAFVNHADWLEAFAATKTVYNEGAEVPFPAENYYFSGYKNLKGYYLRIEKTELIPLESLLSQYDMSLDDLIKLAYPGMEDKVDLSIYGLLYIVTASFWNLDFSNNQDYMINFMDHPLVGPDYLINPDINGILAITEFNEELDGFMFGIKSDRVMTFRIPYLIDTGSEASLTVDYLLSSDPKLLVGFYPEEIYLALPEPEVSE